MSVLPLNVRYRRKDSRLSRLEVSVETIIRNHWKVKLEDSADNVVIICSWENMYSGLLSSLDGCVLVSLHRNPCWNIWNSTSSEVCQTFETPPVTWISHDACSLVCTAATRKSAVRARGRLCTVHHLAFYRACVRNRLLLVPGNVWGGYIMTWLSMI